MNSSLAAAIKSNFRYDRK